MSTACKSVKRRVGTKAVLSIPGLCLSNLPAVVQFALFRSIRDVCSMSGTERTNSDLCSGIHVLAYTKASCDQYNP